MMREYLQLIDGIARAGGGEQTSDIINPADEQILGAVRHANIADIDAAAAAAAREFSVWRAIQPFDRARILRSAAARLRERADDIAISITREQGKPVREARTEVLASADILDWFAEEGRRAYGRIVPGRQVGQSLQVRTEPIGPVAAFTPWNFPLSQAVRKVAAALAAGCSIVLKPPEEAPSGTLALAEALMQAGLPAGVLNLVMGDPALISRHLIASPLIRKISFTGSVPVGKLLAQQAAAHMKPCTMELGGHAPVFVCEDVDATRVARTLVAMKFRNAGQACIAPTRFFIHQAQYETFRDSFVAAARQLRVGNGLDPATEMGPLANARRLQSMEAIIRDAVSLGAVVLCGGEHISERGFFFPPTVIENAPPHSRIMTEEPFGPLAVLQPYRDLDATLTEANRLPFGLSAYVFTDSASRIEHIVSALECGLVCVNGASIALTETPFGGVKDSGYGREGGSEGLWPYIVTKLVAAQLG